MIKIAMAPIIQNTRMIPGFFEAKFFLATRTLFGTMIAGIVNVVSF